MSAKPSRSRRPAALLFAVLGLGGLGAWLDRSGWLYVWCPGLLPPALGEGDYGALLHIRDGDTVEIRYRDLRLPLRLRCVDTAESVHADASRNSDFGRAASEFAKRALAGRRVRVEFEREHGLIACDQHGRALGYLWLEAGGPGLEDDELFNETLIRDGWSRYEVRYGASPRHHARLGAAEAAARAAGSGIWR